MWIKSRFYKFIFITLILESSVFAGARIGIEHEVMFVLDKPLSWRKIVETLAVAYDKDGVVPPPEVWLEKPETSGFVGQEFIDKSMIYGECGFEVGEEVILAGSTEPQKISLVELATEKRDYEILHFEGGGESSAKSARYKNKLVHIDQYVDHIEPGTVDLFEFIAPTDGGYTPTNTYISALQSIESKERRWIELVESYQKNAYRTFQRYGANFLKNHQGCGNSKYSDLWSAAQRYVLANKLGLKTVAFPFGTIPKIYVQDYFGNLRIRNSIQARSYHLSIQMPDKQGRDHEAQAKYSAYILQWLEPLFIATGASGDLSNGLEVGVRGSFRLRNNPYTALGSVSLRHCEEGESENCSLKPNEPRASIKDNCHLELLGIEKFGIDLKGKDRSPNAVNYANGFELRIFDNARPEDFKSTIEFFALALAHSDASFGRSLKDLTYVNLFSGKETQSLMNCGPCSKFFPNAPCNSWQLTVAELLTKGYRAKTQAAFIAALEKGLDLKFWHHKEEEAYVFEVSEALVAELFKRYHSHPLVIELLGHALSAKPNLPLMSLKEWSSYFRDPETPWHAKWDALKTKLANQEHRVYSRNDFVKSYLGPHFGEAWSAAHDDILFTLEAEQLIQLELADGSIRRICLHCRFPKKSKFPGLAPIVPVRR